MSKLKTVSFALILTTMVTGPDAFAQVSCAQLFEPRTVTTGNRIDTQAERLLKANRPQEAAWEALRSGDRSTFERIEENLKKELETGQIVDSSFMGIGAGESYLVTFQSGVRAIFKPDPKFWLQADHFAKDIANTKAEVDAYRVDRLLELNVVPVTVEREIQGITGSLQAFVRTEFGSTYERSSLVKMRFLDYLIHNTDRHDLNYLITNGQVAAIDHGMAFRNSFLDTSPFTVHLEQLQFGPEAQGLLHALQTSFTREAAYNTLTGRHSRMVVHQVLRRRENLIKALEKHLQKEKAPFRQAN